MHFSVTREDFDSLAEHGNLKWHLPFVLPDWLKVWWRAFGAGAKLYLAAVRDGDETIGIAPLLVRDNTAQFIGSVDVCDYLDFVIAQGRERDFFNVLLDDLPQKGVTGLDLRTLRPESTVIKYLVGVAKERGYSAVIRQEDVSLELDLPDTWDGYLDMLSGKQRHEVRRKLRGLEEEGDVSYRVIEDSAGIRAGFDTFLRLFAISREDKATFLTPAMESFFRALVDPMTESGVLRLGVLEFDDKPVAMLMYFDYQNIVYLYNSGYDPQYSYLSVGLLSKVMCIRDSILRKRRKFDFLKGGEIYKYHLGGREVPLYGCRIQFR